MNREMTRILESEMPIGFDIETTGFNPNEDRLVAVQFKPQGKRAYIIDARDWLNDELKGLLGPLFSDKTKLLVGHNLSFDLHWMITHLGIMDIQARVYDTMIAELLIQGVGWSESIERGVGVNLLSTGERYGIEVKKEGRAYFPGLIHRPEWNEPFPQEQRDYMRQDVSVVHLIRQKQALEIERQGLQTVVDLEMRLVPIVAGMRHWGQGIDIEKWREILAEVGKEQERLEEIIHEELAPLILLDRHNKYMEKFKPYKEWVIQRDEYVEELKDEYAEATGWGEYKKRQTAEWYTINGRLDKPPANREGINLGSWKQVLAAFHALGVNVEAVNAEALAPHVNEHPIVQTYLEYSGYRKITTVYGEEFMKKVIPQRDGRGRVYASWQQIGTGTGRFSSYDPNFQQVPSDGPGARLREAVVPKVGYVFVDADFSNIELLIAAELSGDTFLMDAFESGEDIHAYTAKVMWDLKLPEGTNLKEWTSKNDAVVGNVRLLNTSYRKVAKTINYMLLYGAGPKRLSIMLRISLEEAKGLMEIYNSTFQGAIKWLKTQGDRLAPALANPDKKRISSVTKLGRRRWYNIPRIQLPRNVTVEEAEEARDKFRKQCASIRRQLANSPIQGLSADITKLAAVTFIENIGGLNEDIRLIGMIHDEFLVEARDQYIWGGDEPMDIGEGDQTFAQLAQRELEDAMLYAMKTFLKKVHVKRPEAVIVDHWEH